MHESAIEHLSAADRKMARLIRRDFNGRPIRVIDLGCGSGELTAWLHRGLEEASTLGIDSSEAMLGRARAQVAAHVGGWQAQRAESGNHDVREVLANTAPQRE